MFRAIYLIIFIFAVGGFCAYSQEPPAVDSISVDTLGKTTPKEEFPMSKSPMGAIVRSLILPGWGQFYVEDYWKTPIFLGGAGALVGIIIWNHDYYIDYQDQYDYLIANEPENTLEIDLMKKKKEFYRDQRDMSGFFLLSVYVLAAIDAYVGAHLYDFPSDDISFGIGGNSFGVVGLQVSIKLK